MRAFGPDEHARDHALAQLSDAECHASDSAVNGGTGYHDYAVADHRPVADRVGHHRHR